MSNDIFETEERWLVNRYANWHKRDWVDYAKALPTLRARIAMDLASRFGVIAAQPDGEDAAGQSKLALMPPEDVVSRSVSMADMLVSEFEQRGWMDQMPSPHDRFGDVIFEGDE